MVMDHRSNVAAGEALLANPHFAWKTGMVTLDGCIVLKVRDDKDKVMVADIVDGDGCSIPTTWCPRTSATTGPRGSWCSSSARPTKTTSSTCTTA